ncbi:MAG TPA: UTP--glucose-1-phosphate uridylyltransferase GalU [Alphaproteobacteria bacterium]|nr:UTP--glucose-1-phosphate uridylyltransferase GalU [Alphaproteobacteria bacterium]
MIKRVRKAVFPVGGLGTRFLPATKAMPKEMLPVADIPLIQYAVEEAQAAGIEQFIFVTGRGKTAIEDHFDQSSQLEEMLEARGKLRELSSIRRWLPPPGAITYTRQQRPLGLGHAVGCAAELIGDEPFAVLLADDLVLARTPCLKQMLDVYDATGGNVIAVMDVPLDQVSRYGVVAPGERRGRVVEVRGLVEKPKPETAPSRLAVIGRYVLQPAVLRHLKRLKPGAGAEIQLTDAMAKALAEDAFVGYRFEGRRFDCGDKIGFLEANLAFALSRPDLAPAVRDILRRYGSRIDPDPWREPIAPAPRLPLPKEDAFAKL